MWITLLVDLVGCRSIDVSNRVVFKMHFLYFKVPVDKLLVYWRLYEAPTKALIKYVCVFFVWHYCPLDLSLSANQLAPKRQHTPNDFSVLAKSFSIQETRREKNPQTTTTKLFQFFTALPLVYWKFFNSNYLVEYQFVGWLFLNIW